MSFHNGKVETYIIILHFGGLHSGAEAQQAVELAESRNARLARKLRELGVDPDNDVQV